MIPDTFTKIEVEKAIEFIINHIKTKTYIKNGDIRGEPRVYYKHIADLFDWTFDTPGDDSRIGEFAGEISQWSHNKYGFMLSAVIVNSNEDKQTPGNGFYKYAQYLGYLNINRKIDLNGLEELKCWKDQITEVVKKFAVTK